MLVAAVGTAEARSPGLAEPFPWKDPGQMALPFLQLPFESPETLEPGHLSLALQTFYSSNVGRNATDSLIVDYRMETAQPTLVLRWAFQSNLELHLELPGVAQEAGFLNGSIKAVESIFGKVNSLRFGGQSRTAHFRLSHRDGRTVSWRGAEGALGDVWGGLKAHVHDQDLMTPSLAVRCGLSIPTGRFPYGSGALELGAGVLAGWEGGGAGLFAAADLSVPTDSAPTLHIGTRPHPALQVGISRPLSSWVSANAQMSAHAPAFEDVGMKEISAWTYYVLAGVRANAFRSWFVDLGLAENLFNAETGADITGLLVLEWHPP